jgi:hypothetical protein
LAFRFTTSLVDFFFPIFILECGFGGWRTSWAMIRFAASSGSGDLGMAAPFNRNDKFDPGKQVRHEVDISPKTLTAIGVLITAAASAEIAITYQIIACISNDEQTRANVRPLIASQNISVKLATLRTIFTTRASEYENALQGVGRLQKCFDMRNLFAHGLIMVKGKTPPNHVMVAEIKKEGEKREWAKPKTIATTQILTCGREITFWIRQIEAEIRSQGAAPAILKEEILANL